MADPSHSAVSEVFPVPIRDAVRDATADFFSRVGGLSYRERGAPGDGAAGVVSTISFLGDPAWTYSLMLPDAVAVAVAKGFAGFDIPFDSPDMGDLIGEVVNVIAGGICAKLEARGIRAQMSLPTVMRGGNVSVCIPAHTATKQLVFTGSSGTCWCRLVMGRSAVSRLSGT